MKKIMIIVCLAFFLTSWNMFDYNKNDIPKSEQAVNNLLGKIARSLEKKYKMYPSGIAVSMPGGVVRELGLDFQIRGPLSKEEIRKILICSAQDFLKFINADDAVRSYLKIYPFEIKDIEVTLFVIDARGRGLDDPYIGIAGISEGRLDYQVLTGADIPITTSSSEETYEEALKILQNSE